MWPRKRLDIRLTDVAYGIYRCLLPPNDSEARHNVEICWARSDNVLACLSVRSGFDLLLGTLKLPAGSEVLVSAVTIPHMIDIIRHHGLVPVPVDVDADTLAPQIGALQRAVAVKARVVLVAHLFGSRFDMTPILNFARDNKLLVIEDCAQAFDGAYRGYREADVSLYSFGPIKTCTALGGAIVCVRDPRLLQRMSLRYGEFPRQGRCEYLARLLKYAVLISLSTQTGFGLLVRACRAFGRDYDRLLTATARSFAGGCFYERIRRTPNAALLSLLKHRLRQFDVGRLEDRTMKGEWLLSLLHKHVYCPGRAAPSRSHWVFPILVDRPSELVADLREARFDASRSHSLCVVDPPTDRPEVEPSVARAMLAHLVFLPVYPEIPRQELHRMADVVIKSAGRRFIPPSPPQTPAAILGGKPELHLQARVPAS